jgi:hypothetical protein
MVFGVITAFWFEQSIWSKLHSVSATLLFTHSVFPNFYKTLLDRLKGKQKQGRHRRNPLEIH